MPLSCPTLWPHMDSKPTRSLSVESLPGKKYLSGCYFQLQDLPDSRDETLSHVSCIGAWFFTTAPPEAPIQITYIIYPYNNLTLLLVALFFTEIVFSPFPLEKEIATHLYSCLRTWLDWGGLVVATVHVSQIMDTTKWTTILFPSNSGHIVHTFLYIICNFKLFYYLQISVPFST